MVANLGSPKIILCSGNDTLRRREHNPSGMLAGRNRSAVASPNTKGCQKTREASLAKLGKPGKPGSTEREKWSRV